MRVHACDLPLGNRWDRLLCREGRPGHPGHRWASLGPGCIEDFLICCFFEVALTGVEV